MSQKVKGWVGRTKGIVIGAAACGCYSGSWNHCCMPLQTKTNGYWLGENTMGKDSPWQRVSNPFLRFLEKKISLPPPSTDTQPSAPR
ncbi:hypothetical protein V6N13_052698 [Hibiscus sabdariffa]